MDGRLSECVGPLRKPWPVPGVSHLRSKPASAKNVALLPCCLSLEPSVASLFDLHRRELLAFLFRFHDPNITFGFKHNRHRRDGKKVTKMNLQETSGNNKIINTSSIKFKQIILLSCHCDFDISELPNQIISGQKWVVLTFDNYHN